MRLSSKVVASDGMRGHSGHSKSASRSTISGLSAAYCKPLKPRLGGKDERRSCHRVGVFRYTPCINILDAWSSP